MADELQLTIGRLLADADRDAFAAKITQAHEMGGLRRGCPMGVVSRAMGGRSATPRWSCSGGRQPDISSSGLMMHPAAGAPRMRG